MIHTKYYKNINNNKMQMDRMVFERTFYVESLVLVIKQNNGNRKM